MRYLPGQKGRILANIQQSWQKKIGRQNTYNSQKSVCPITTDVDNPITIDLFTDTAAILNLLDLRSIMGCPGGTGSVFMRSFRAKREFQRVFLGKKAIVIISKHGTTIFFPITIFF